MHDLILVAANEAASQTNWIDVLVAGATGGLAVKGVDLFYTEFRRRSEKKTTVEDFVRQRLDPILKTADELVGKLYSLGQEDFTTMPALLDRNRKDPDNVEVTNVVYLFAQFWGAIEILRRESVYVSLAESPSGATLTRFVRCLESRAVRVLVRAQQRAIGESLVVSTQAGLRTMGYSEFMTALSSNDEILEWITPLADILVATKHGSRQQRKDVRQRLLLYGAVLHALVDSLDPGHTTTRDRPPRTNKLSPATRRDLRSRVFAIYLPEVKDSEKYWK